MKIKIARLFTAATLFFLLAVSLPGYAFQDQREEGKPSEPQEAPKTAKPPEAKPSEPQQEAPRPEPRKEANPAPQEQRQEQKAQQEQNKQQQDEEKKAQEQQKKSDEHQAKQAQHNESAGRAPAAAGNRGTRIPDDRFRASFGRQHTFVINRPVIVENRPRFQYSGYWFEIVDPWPVAWAYTDDCYIDYVDDEYYLFDPLHPGIRLVVVVVG